MSQFTKRVILGSDDGQKYSTYQWYNNFNTISVGKDYKAAVRFQSVGIQPGASISSAYLELTTPQYGWLNPVSLRLYGIDEDNTTTYTTDPTGRATTTAYTNWTINPLVGQTTYKSPDISGLVQEIIDRGGWSGGNAMGIHIRDNGTQYGSDMESYESDAAEAAYLIINYTGTIQRTQVVSALGNLLNPPRNMGIVIAKPTYDAKTDTDPSHHIFNSDYGTLKYYISGSTSVNLGTDDLCAVTTINHNL